MARRQGLPRDHIDEPMIVEEENEYVLAAIERCKEENEAEKEKAAQVGGGGKRRSLFIFGGGHRIDACVF